MVKDILSYGIGTLVAFVVIGLLAFLFIRDITQKKHSVLRNYPVIGRLRYFFEQLGEYFRQYFFAGDRDEMPFNRATRGWVYRLAKNEGGIIGFGSTYDLHLPGALIFVNHPFPVLEEERLPTPSLVHRRRLLREPFEARSIVNISGMSFGRSRRRRCARCRAAQGGRLLDGHRRGRPLALPHRRRLRRHHADRHREVRHARRTGRLVAGKGEGAGEDGQRPSRSSCRRARSPARAACCPAAR